MDTLLTRAIALRTETLNAALAARPSRGEYADEANEDRAHVIAATRRQLRALAALPVDATDDAVRSAVAS